MKAHSSMLQVQMEAEMKRKATTALPNAQTRAAMAEVDEMVRERAARLPSADELSEDLAAENGHELFE